MFDTWSEDFSNPLIRCNAQMDEIGRVFYAIAPSFPRVWPDFNPPGGQLAACLRAQKGSCSLFGKRMGLWGNPLCPHWGPPSSQRRDRQRANTQEHPRRIPTQPRPRLSSHLHPASVDPGGKLRFFPSFCR